MCKPMHNLSSFLSVELGYDMFSFYILKKKEKKKLLLLPQQSLSLSAYLVHVIGEEFAFSLSLLLF